MNFRYSGNLLKSGKLCPGMGGRFGPESPIGIDIDHIHLHMVIPPKYAVSKVIETLKKNTSRQMSEKFRFLKDVYWDERGIWSKGFFVSTVGIDEATIRKYVEMQEKEDTGQAELELN